MPGFRQPKDADIAEAKKLLNEAKLSGGFPLTLISREVANYRDQAIIVSEELKTLGIPATLKIVDTPSLYDILEKRDFAVVSHMLSSWNPNPHFHPFGDKFVAGAGRNYEGVSDERLDSLFAKQARSLDLEERKKLFWEMERILREEIVPVVTFYWSVKVTGYWKDVNGYPGFGLGYYVGNSMEEAWLDR